MHIILLEPDRMLADIYRQSLLSEGHSVTMCASAQSAIFAADEQSPDAVIVELQLIGHSGIEFLYEFRSYNDWRDVPVIIHSQVPPAEFNGSSKLLRQELGVKDYLYKPRTSLATLLRSVQLLSTASL
jgi:DNA-binding response OmpR family regulator